jgi:hypothetical protein
MGEEHTVDSLELRVVEVKSALDVGMTEIKGALALLVQGAETDRNNLKAQEGRIKEEFARLATERTEDRTAQAKKDEDQETRLRALEKHVYKVTGMGVAGSMALGAVTGVALHFWR